MKIVLAYSGGLDTSVILAWLKENYDAEIVTFAADVGQEEELNGLAEKAKRTGASEHYTIDLVEEFASDFIYPMMRANTLYEGQYHLGTSIARPLIAKAQVELARKVGARGLRMILEELMLDLMYHLPSNKRVRDIEITREMVERRALSLCLLEKAG